MPSISKIRLTNVVYEEGNKRYNDELFLFDGHNGAVLLENGGGKTVFIQTVLQAVLPHVNLADRKIKHTLMLENDPAHIAVEWITNDNPRRYVVTAISLFTTKNGLDSMRYVYEYGGNDPDNIEEIPFVREGKEGKRSSERGEMQDYYNHMRDKTLSARTFNTIKDYKLFLEEQYHIISSEWESIVKINSLEGGVEAFFNECKSTNQLFDRLLIPTVENSIVGHDEYLFADMFQQRYTSFKNYKKLKETLEENKQIESQLENYTGTYEKFHHRELEYEQVKQRAKGTWNKISQEKQQYTNERVNTLEKLEEWKKSKHNHDVKSASYEIFVEETILNRLKAEFNEVLGKQSMQEEYLRKYAIDYYSLKLAKMKQEKKEQEDALRHIERELAKYDQTEDMDELKDQLEQEKCALLGWYLEEIEKLKKDRQELIYQLNPIKKQINLLDQKKHDLSENEKDLYKQLSKSVSRIETRSKDIEQLKQLLLSNPEQENVQEELIKWQVRSQDLDDQLIELRREEKQSMIEVKEAEERKEDFQSTHATTEKSKNEIVFKLSAMEEAQKSLIEVLSSLRSQWVTLENVYLSQESIEKRLIETIDKLTKDKDNLLLKERVAYRFVDDHGNQETFFSDAFLEQQLTSWKNQVDFLVTGVEFLQNMEIEEREKHEHYPLWPMTLVTTNRSRQKVIDKLNHVREQIQFPIIVMTTEEAQSPMKERINNWIGPSHWHKNLDASSFMEWKKEISAYAKDVTIQRKEKEQHIKKWEDGLKAFNQFLSHFSYDKITKLKEELTQLKNQLGDLSASIQRETNFLAEQRTKSEHNKKLAEQYGDEKQGLDWKIERGHQYLKFEKEVNEEKKNEKETEHRLSQVIREMARLNEQLATWKEEQDDLEDRIRSTDAKLDIVKHDETYTSLQSFSPRHTGESKKTITEKMMSLEMKIREINVTRGEWIAKETYAKESIQRLNKSMNELLNEHPFVEETRDFPGDGVQLMETLREKMVNLKQKVEKLAAIVTEKKSNLDKQKGKWETKKDQLIKDFPDTKMITFNQSLEEISEELVSEGKHLDERKAYIDRELTRIENELKDVEKAKYGLELFEEGHHFTAPDIVAISLSAEEALEFTYNRQKMVKAIKDALKETKALVEAEKKEVDRAKRKFREFCMNNISDMKLQKMATNGVENKQNYKDVIEFKKNMLMRIEKISHYANEYIRKSDEDLQLFINQIHSHLLTLVEELKEIPKRTKVKVMDDWKTIFTFKIPVWEEEVGKMRIRDYVEWILKQLESDRFLNEQNMQDDEKIRKEVEMWLQSKQLLQMVMNNEVMKVSCRKVTNDNKVTTRSYSWEQSNVWSGGEKWSKNMTLFLGILNYVAEKKKQIQPGMKHHRVVILDNPFGKASSDHVLSPVFFVAEQLGFQIIALTAHTEGKFLQDYFPIIYSCRLRASTDSSKKVMAKEKWLHHAYFQDHEPKSIVRLGETEQITLFE
ncbi:hypothetical protein [Terrilactibacillus laevilacticus]|uniref:hypothetical protein n=1 Tax=Terrilactibacillus laevilacticus TaxID=1380157 RepID=UPI001146A510|nr:hypothetical protein [Terrilactibacillus laevilacticus]